MTDKLFLDTAFAIALISPKDVFHDKAMALSRQIRQDGMQMFTTRAILIEIGNALAKANTRQAAINMLQSIETDDDITIVPMTEELYKESFKLYGSRLDKEWGLVDCVSFVVMQKFDLTEALTSDRHFEQAGFIPLMR